MPRVRVEEEIAQSTPGATSARGTMQRYDEMIRRAHELRAGADRGRWGVTGRASLRSVALALADEGLTFGRVLTPATLRRMLARTVPRPRDPGETNERPPDNERRRRRSFQGDRGRGKRTSGRP